ncbi:hypothetical protein [Pseudonocardia xinjiangensis]|uniref:hypothetical protein n=1 Tax=Pseudonocardia xinjiangensis TaxID=75289 RepID=UPI001B7CEFDA|nr:hypothetical protein [Pseudonocardia xinjiangensis]
MTAGRSGGARSHRTGDQLTSSHAITYGVAIARERGIPVHTRLEDVPGCAVAAGG